jgi:2-hydroxy-6-oxonona-2,4-dienedioate hydrolase
MGQRRDFESGSIQVESGSLSLRIHSLSSRGRKDDQPTVVVLPGLGASCRSMLPMSRLLPLERDVYIVELPAQGESERPPRPLSLSEYAAIAASWLREVGLERAAWVGHSFGSQVLVELAVDVPEIVECLTLISPTVDSRGRTMTEQLGRLVLDATREPPRLLSLLIRDYLRSSVRSLRDMGRIAVRDRLEEKLPSIDAPTLVVRGGRDPIVPQRWAEEVVSLLPNATLVVIPGGTHAVQYEPSAALVRTLQAFLAEDAHPPFGVA